MFGRLNSLNSLNKVVKFSKNFKKKKFSKIIYCPPNTLLYPVIQKLKNTNIQIGAQNCHESQNFGPFTGSINSMMIKNIGAKYVILGHSENRKSGETDKLINLKIKSAINSKLKVIFCIGETLRDRKKKITKRILKKQIKLGLDKIKDKKNIIIAYEPVWSIGTGFVANNRDLSKSVAFIKKMIKNVKVLYGGSVNTKNIKELKFIKNIDGFLIGGASQNAKKFIDIIKKTYN
tara:strand:- start:1228 stop:1926 length:699 start_codon:yes stop_codon:yes gene_type:complete